MIELDSPTLGTLVATLGWTLLHFLWQGAVAGVLFGLSLSVASRSAARTRYNIALFFLALLALCPIVTFIWLSPDLTRTAATAAAVLAPVTGAVIAVGQSSGTDLSALVGPWLPWTVLIWAAGVALMTGRLLLEWRDIRRLTRLNVEPLSAEWSRKVERLRASIGVRRTVQVLRSARVHVPMVIGWLKPVILVPVSAFTGLTPWQLELVLMHELAHVRRHDYLVNLAQVVVETLLFYHPVVRWVSRVLREEREHCCDDLVVARSGDALSYAHALTELAGAQTMRLQTSVGSDGGKLLVRIKRIVVEPEPPRVSTHWSIGVVLAAFGLGVSGLLHPVRDVIVPDSDFDPIQVSAPGAAARLPIAARVKAAVIDSAVLEPIALSSARRLLPEPVGAGIGVSVASAAAPVAVEMPAAAGQSIQLPVTEEIPVVAPLASSPQPSIPGDNSGAAPSVPVAPPEAAAATAPAPASPPAVARRISGSAPEFPVNARLDGVEGWVTFSYTIDVQGQVRDLKIVDARPRHAFESSVRKAVRSWSFEPIEMDGRPVERPMTQTIYFTFDSIQSPATDTCLTSTGTRICRPVGEPGVDR